MTIMLPHHQRNEDEVWGTHYPSVDTSNVSPLAINLVFVVLFICFSFINHYMKTRAMAFVLALMLAMVTMIWVIIVYKLIESVVWPLALRFRANGVIELELAWSTKELDARNGGVTLLKVKVSRCMTGGVWANAVTDRNEEFAYVLVPTDGPRYWRGFVFQPEDSRVFLRDCAHAGVIIQNTEEENEMTVPFVTYEQHTQEESIQRNEAYYETLIDDKDPLFNNNIIEV